MAHTAERARVLRRPPATHRRRGQGTVSVLAAGPIPGAHRRSSIRCCFGHSSRLARNRQRKGAPTPCGSGAVHASSALCQDPYEDGFYVQRPAIEDHAQNEPHGLIDALITAVRDATERLIAEDKASVPGLVVMLERRGWQVFDRLALHLLWRFPEAAPDLIAERLIDRRRF